MARNVTIKKRTIRSYVLDADGHRVLDPETGRPVRAATGTVVYRVRWEEDDGTQREKSCGPRKKDAQTYADNLTAAVVTGTYVTPATAKTTLSEWCDQWIVGYGTRRRGTVRAAKVHIKHIKAGLGTYALAEIKPSMVRAWLVDLQSKKLAQSFIYAIYRRLAQIMSDAVHDGVIPRSPCSRRTSPRQPTQRPFVATTEQIWSLYDAFPEHLRPAVLLGAFSGLRTAEAAGLRISDVDFLARVIRPAVQYPAEDLKTENSKWPIPIPEEMVTMLSAAVKKWGGKTIVTDGMKGQTSPWAIERAMRAARKKVEGLPPGFRFHDLRHYFASLLIAAGLDIKVVQTRMRHASAVTTLNVYGHMMPDRDETARAAVAEAFTTRAVVGNAWATEG